MAALVGLAMLVTIAQSEDVDALAAAAGVDAQDLVAASDSVGVAPSVYLRTTAPHAPAPPPAHVWSIWDTLASCESNGRWNISTGNGYFGGLQFDRQTWLAYGGGAYASTANLATRAQQIAVAERLRAARGFQPWPACSRLLGLR